MKGQSNFNNTQNLSSKIANALMLDQDSAEFAERIENRYQSIIELENSPQNTRNQIKISSNSQSKEGNNHVSNEVEMASTGIKD